MTPPTLHRGNQAAARGGGDGRPADLSARHQQLAAGRGVRSRVGDPARGAPPRLQRAAGHPLLLDVPVAAPALPRRGRARVRDRARHPDLRVGLPGVELPLAQHERGRGRRLPQAAHRRGRGLDRRDRGGGRRPVRPRHRPPLLHEHGGAARRDPAPRRGRAGHDAAARVRARHRAEDVQQREAGRQPGGVPAALPAVHAEREDLRLRRPRARRGRGRGDLAGAGRGARERVPRVPPRAGDPLAQRLQPGRLPGAAGDVRQPGRGARRVHDEPPEGSGRAPEPVAPADGFDAVVAFCGKFADWKRLDALLHAAASYEQRTDTKILTLVVGLGSARGPGADARPRRRAGPAPHLLRRARARRTS